MPVPSVVEVAIAAVLAAAAPAPLRFEQAFPIQAGPRASHAVIRYRGADGAVHRLELWRDGERRVRRDTDRRLTAVAAHRPGETGYRLDLFDHDRRIHNVVDRTSLYRVGRLSDWRDLAHGLRHPVGAYTVRMLTKPPAGVAAAAPCRWFALDEAGRRATICWSAAEALPLVILDAKGQLVWRVAAIDHDRAADGIMAPHPAGYILNDASQDISGD